MIKPPDFKRKSVEVIKYIDELKIAPTWVETSKRIKTGAFNSNF